MKTARPLLLLSLTITLLTAMEFLIPSINQFITPVFIAAVGIYFWRVQKLRWLFFSALFISVIPELQVQVLGPIELHHALILICFGYFVVPWLFFAPKKLPKLTTLLIGYYIVLAGVTLVHAGSIQSWHRLSIVLFMVLLAVTMPHYIKTRQHFKELFIAIIITGVFASLVALGALYVATATNTYFESPYLHMSITEGVPRLAGPLLDSNFLGNLLLLSFPACLGLLLLGLKYKIYKEWSTKKKIALSVALVLLGAVLLLTYSRSAYLGLGAAIVLFAVMLGRRTFTKNSRRLAVVLGGIILAACVIYPPFLAYSVYRTPSVILPTESKDKLLLGFDPRTIANDYIKKIQNNGRLTDEERDALLARDVSSDSLGYRLLFWRAGIEMFKDHPIIGVGVGQFRYQFKNYVTVTHLREPDTHNIFIEQLAETGVIGFTIFLLVLFVTFKNFWRASRASTRWFAAVGVIGLASFVAVLVQSALLGGLGAIPIYILFGLASSIEPLIDAKQKKQLHRQDKAGQPRRLVYVTATTKRDGPGNMLALLIQNIDRTKYEPIVITVLGGGDWDELYRTLNVQRINLGLKKPLDLLGPVIVWWWLWRLKPDLVHTQMIRADVYGRWAAARVEVPVVTAVHNIDNWKRSYKIGHRMMTWIDAQSLAATSSVIAVSQAVRNHLIDRQGILLDAVAVVPNGIQNPAQSDNRIPRDSHMARTKYKIPHDAVLIGTTARVAQQKAPEVWLSAAIQVLQQRPNVQFIWAGQGPMLDSMISITHKRGLEKVIHFVGQINDVPELLRTLDIYVLSSRFEGLPLSLLEAMSAGVASIASNVAGNPEVIEDGRTGLLVAPNDSQALASAMIKLIETPALRKQFGDAGQKFVRETFSPKKMTLGYEQVYDVVMSKDLQENIS